jgi:ABC-type branched-subunit amino acid transport system ATPase component
MNSEPALLELREVSKRFAGLLAVQNVSLRVTAREIVGLVGPNGAGKSTLLNLIAGAETPSHGQILFREQPVTSLSEPARARAGIARLFQELANLDDFSVRDNVELGRVAKAARRGFVDRLVYALQAPEESTTPEPACALVLDKLGTGLLDAKVGELSHWQRRLVSFARALASEPLLLLLDEPFAGLSFGETREFSELVRRVRGVHGQSFLVVEHNLDALLALCDRVIVLHLGEKIADEAARSVTSNQRVIDVYLGGR